MVICFSPLIQKSCGIGSWSLAEKLIITAWFVIYESRLGGPTTVRYVQKSKYCKTTNRQKSKLCILVTVIEIVINLSVNISPIGIPRKLLK